MNLSIFDKILAKAKDSTVHSKTITLEGLLVATFRIVDATVDRKISAAMEAVFEASTQHASEAAFDYVRRYTIAHYLETLDGEVIPHGDIEGIDDSAEDRIAEKLLELPAFITDIMYSACIDLRKEYKDRVNKSVKCTWFDKPMYETNPTASLDATNPMTTSIDPDEVDTDPLVGEEPAPAAEEAKPTTAKRKVV